MEAEQPRRQPTTVQGLNKDEFFIRKFMTYQVVYAQ
jgi:hypothetical protein